MTPLTDGNSYWIETTPATEFTPLAETIEVDVCVIGGGITGLLTAWELVEAGLDVAVLESKRIATSVTGYTTAKLTSQHGLRYKRLTDEQGPETARAYGQANEAALRRIREIARQLDVSADIEERDAYIFATRPESLSTLRAEAQAAGDAGLPAMFTEIVPLPFPTFGAVRFHAQAQLHPRRLLLPLATALMQRGVSIYEDSKATDVTFDGRWTVSCERGDVHAKHVVVATLFPSAGVGADLRQHLYCHQGYAVALPLTSGDGPDGVFISHERPMRSIRTINADGGRLLQMGGAAHVTDPNSGDSPYDDLEAWAKEHFDVGEARYRWTTQDYSSVDGMPLIGRLDPNGLYVATGFGGWGLTTAGVAASIVRRQITGQADNDVSRIFDPHRDLATATSRIVSKHTSSGTDRDATEVVESLAPGAAAVVTHSGEQIGAYRDHDGELQLVSAVCTHLGGIVLWDPSDTTWTCPCHGSKFKPSGEVSQGPARTPLPEMRNLLDHAP